MRPTALSIAGSDSGGGAGIQADLKTFFAFGVYGMAAPAALTAQNTLGVMAIHAPPAAFVAQQIDAVLDDIGADAVKTGMLGSAEIVEVVADRLAEHKQANVVVDPVTVAKGGALLLGPDGIEALRRRLFPLARIITPNAAEAEALTGHPIRGLADMREAARRLADLGPKAVLVKGGHVEVEPGIALDILFHEGRLEEFAAPRTDARFTHGAGCALSAAIAAGLALGNELPTAVKHAKAWLSQAIGKGFVPGRGKGHGAPDHEINPT